MLNDRTIKKSILIESIIAFIMLTPALICLAIGIWMNYEFATKMNGMVKTKATVTRVETELTHWHTDDPEDDVAYAYKVFAEYEYNGKMIEVQSDVGDDKLSKGDVIDFWYDPDDPTRTSAGLAALNKTTLPFLLLVPIPFCIVPFVLIFDIIKKIKYLRRNRYIDYGFEPDPYYKK